VSAGRALLLAAAVMGGAGGQTPDPSGATVQALVDRLEAAWQTRDLAGYLALWSFRSDAARAEQADFATAHFAADETLLQVQRPSAAREASGRLELGARVFSVSEPRGRVEEWLLRLERGAQGWALVERRPAGEIEGLVHLSLDPQGVRAEGLTLTFEDFALQMRSGTLFLSPKEVGPTLLAFVGDGSVRFAPQPAAERDQLREFCGRPELLERVRRAFIRIHPADLGRVLAPLRLEPDPGAAQRLGAAQKLFRSQVNRSFVLDAALPRSPWWLQPGLGDASVSFETDGRGTLTYTVSRGEFESISLFDRNRRLQISLYPGQNGDTHYNEDDARPVDVLHHELRVRFQPDRYQLAAEDTLRLRLLAASTTLRLRLDEALLVESVTSSLGRHLFFRVRGQDSLVVSLGALAGRAGAVELSVRYSGTLRPAPVEQEVQAGGVIVSDDDGPPLQETLVYSNRLPWYPTVATDDYATARLQLDVPHAYAALAGGARGATREEGDRALFEYVQDRPGKYISVALGRLVPVGTGEAAGVALEAFGLPRTRDEAREMLAESGEILRFFAGQFGPPPYPELRLALIEGVAPGGHSPPGMVVLSRRPALLRGRLRDDPANFGDVPGFFLAHELAHQWWGHAVAGQNYRERWVSEGFAQYAAALWIGHSQGEQAFRNLLGRMASWAERRNDEGPIHLGYRLGHIAGDRQTFRAVVYDKGALVLHMLRGIVGDEAFRQALMALQSEYRFRKTGSDDLRVAFERASGRPLAAYFDAWIYGTALPTLEVSRHAEPGGPPHRTRVEVKAQGLPGPVPLELALAYRGGRVVRRVELAGSGGAWTLETPSSPGKLDVNGDRGLLARIRD
jgi:hypothetical protein